MMRMMRKFALLAVLLVASTGALRIPDSSDKTHGDGAVFEIHDQQVIGQYHSTEHGQGIFVGDDDAARLPTQEPPYTDYLKPGEPWHPGPVFTNLTIYEALSANEHYSKLVRFINYDKDYVDFLNSTSHNITFFAPNNQALTFPKHKKGKKRPHEPHDVLATLCEQFESLTDDDDEKRKKILHAILQYHTLPKKVIRPALHFNTTFATLLIAKDGSFGGQARRIGVESHGLLPFSPLKINFYAFVLPKEWYTANGVVYTVSRPLLPPPSIMNELYLGNNFFILTSALQKVRLDDRLSWGWKKKDSSSEKGATVTFFAPSDQAFKRLPPKLRRFLFSPFGARALKKILSYHIVPDVILHTDYFYNATKDELDKEPQWHEEELYDTAAFAFGHNLLGTKRKSHCNSPHELWFDRIPRFGLAAAGRLPSQKRKYKGPRGWCDQSSSPAEEIPIPGRPEHEPRTGPPKLPHWPPRWPAPAKYYYVLPTVLEDSVLHVTVTKPLPHHPNPPFEDLPDSELPMLADDVPPGAPPEHKRPPAPVHHVFGSSITVDGQRTRLEAVARNGAVHTIGRLLNPFKKPHHEPPTDPKEGEDGDWADWEDWLPAWAEL